MSNGLEGVIAAETRLSDVDGERGRLIIAGHDVEALAGRASYEEVAAILLALGDGRDGTTAADVTAFRSALGEARAAAFERLGRLGDALDAPDGMDALRAACAHLPGDTTPAGVIGAAATFAAAWARRRAGAAPVPPDPSLSHARDLLRMIRGQDPSDADAAGLDAYLVTVSDHGMNASTFTARVITSTGSDLVSSVVGAIGALKGPLHGGAPGPVLDMLDAIGDPARAEAWLDAELGAGP